MPFPHALGKIASTRHCSEASCKLALGARVHALSGSTPGWTLSSRTCTHKASLRCVSAGDAGGWMSAGSLCCRFYTWTVALQYAYACACRGYLSARSPCRRLRTQTHGRCVNAESGLGEACRRSWRYHRACRRTWSSSGPSVQTHQKRRQEFHREMVPEGQMLAIPEENWKLIHRWTKIWGNFFLQDEISRVPKQQLTK